MKMVALAAPGCDRMDRASEFDFYDLAQKVGFQEKTRKTDGREGSQSVLLVNWSVTICPKGFQIVPHCSIGKPGCPQGFQIVPYG